VSWLHPSKEQKLIVVGSDKMAVFDDMAENKLVLYPHRVDWAGRMPTAVKGEAVPVPLEKAEPLKAECEHFLECVATRESPLSDGHEGLRVLRVLDACQKSLEQTVGVTPNPALAPAAKEYVAHETTCIDQPCTIGKGTKIWHFSHIMKGAEIGQNCSLGQNVVVGSAAVIGSGVKIQNNVSIYDGVILEDHVFCGPSMVFTNVNNPRSEVVRKNEYRPTLVKRGATLGANCTIVCGHTIGEYAFVAAGAVISHDVPDYALVAGVPARQLGWMCRCAAERLEFSDTCEARCTACGMQYLFNDGAVRPVDDKQTPIPVLE
jgi:UDP-2-acetamido-3-amino-2,3-dideoxy-glucuronate N-acetyltransferase